MRRSSLCVLLLACGAALAASGPAAADICDEQPLPMRKPCREARELIMRDQSSQPEPERTILATGSKDGWRYEYRRPGVGVSDACSVTGTLVLPADIRIRLLVTASDTIHEWRLPEFGLALTGIPGRIEEAVIALPPGTADDGSETSERKGPRVDVRALDADAYAAWERKTLPPSCRAGD